MTGKLNAQKAFFQGKLKIQVCWYNSGKRYDSVGVVNAQKAFFQGNLKFRLVSVILGKCTTLLVSYMRTNARQTQISVFILKFKLYAAHISGKSHLNNK
jgi:hypothetical protein